MNKNVFLKPGDWFFGKGEGKVSTILGSCVSMVLWHPKHQLLGVSHILLPSRQSVVPGSGELPVTKPDLSGRFADELIDIFKLETPLFHVNAAGFTACLVGGGNMFPHSQNAPAIGEKNVETCRQLLTALAIPIITTDTGGAIYRRLTVNIATGQIHIERSTVNRFELLFA
ncbi:chemotaxis protein CheD [Alishewanella tabrizica]|uniref:Probable chemoreceptor glutamine deamidase CheD n=1 Tax=Alishewanella tabrizica TaxID=671278 RepID=A0ABQ2WHP9_9ALTE|nr:chemotaxis protein CheD [Alishewanella tabrizica]GGW57020.1 putative chemoreceptor glutamine deamidase CheD [Alishewanella tabrizica]